MSAREARSDMLRALWHAAVVEPLGVLVQASDFDRLRQALYAERRKMGVPALEGFQIRASTLEGGNMVICRPPQQEQQ